MNCPFCHESIGEKFPLAHMTACSHQQAKQWNDTFDAAMRNVAEYRIAEKGDYDA